MLAARLSRIIASMHHQGTKICLAVTKDNSKQGHESVQTESYIEKEGSTQQVGGEAETLGEHALRHWQSRLALSSEFNPDALEKG